MLSTQLLADKLNLTLDEVIARLPSSVTPATDESLEDYLRELYTLGRARHIPNISPLNVEFLQNLLRQHQPKRILEIGCANGYSSLRLWQVARAWGAHLVTMDISHPTYLEAKHHFEHCGADIELHFGNALQVLPTLTGNFDFILIDARKKLTLDFFVRARKLAAPNSLIVIDDVLKFKDKMANFYDHLAAHHIEHEIIQLPDDEDGVMLIRI